MVILYLGQDAHRFEQYQKALQDQDLILVGDEDLDHTIQDLFNRSSNHQIKEGTMNPFMIADINVHDPEEVGRFLDTLKSQGIEQPLLALRTEHNEKWTLKALKEEIEKEAAYFEKRKQLTKLIQSFGADQLEADPKVKKSVMTAYMMLQAPELPEDQLDLAIEVLESLQ